jgi:hypothetical protein
MKFSGRGCHQQNLSSSPEQLSRSKFQTAYSDIEDRRKRRILTFDIEKIDSSINLSTVDCLCIVGERKYTNSILMRLCVRALISKRQGGFESTNVIFLDAGNNSDVFYKCVNFTRQYGLNIKKVLQSIMMTRAFTIYQLADLLIYELPRIIEQFNNNGNVAVVLIADLLNLFTNDPNIDLDEAIFLIKEIIISIRKTLDNTLVVVSFQQYNNNDHHHKSYAEYDKILLPRFDKRIEITRNNNDSNSNINLLDVKVYNNNKQSKKNCSRSLLLEERDLQIIPVPR